MELSQKYTLGYVGDVELTTDDVAEWSRDVFRYAANVLNQQPDPYGMGVWKHLQFGSMFLPDNALEIDIRPIKRLVKMICAVYEPGPDYGPAPNGDEFLRTGSDARETYWRLHQAMKRIRREPLPSTEVGPFELQWLKLIFGRDDDRTLKKDLGVHLRKETQNKWFVSASKLPEKWRATLSKADKLSDKSQARLTAFLRNLDPSL